MSTQEPANYNGHIKGNEHTSTNNLEHSKWNIHPIVYCTKIYITGTTINNYRKGHYTTFGQTSLPSTSFMDTSWGNYNVVNPSSNRRNEVA